MVYCEPICQSGMDGMSLGKLHWLSCMECLDCYKVLLEASKTTATMCSELNSSRIAFYFCFSLFSENKSVSYYCVKKREVCGW